QSSPSYQDAQKTINLWQSQLEQLEQQLTKLRERAQELEKSGDVAGAIAIYEKMKETSQKEGSQAYGKAQEAISRLWQRLEQQQNEKNKPKDEDNEPNKELDAEEQLRAKEEEAWQEFVTICEPPEPDNLREKFRQGFLEAGSPPFGCGY
ncbi:MAG: hypothetical protein F6K41_43560, partial [Symploca sp. SIO3E6]|nr:hypothetical protein [Caldora sp. SIO3E6]